MIMKMGVSPAINIDQPSPPMATCAHCVLTMLSHAQTLQLPPALLAVVATFIPFATAQYPPQAVYDSVLNSQIDPSITISYKQPRPGTCMTAFPTQKQYTGYIDLPPYTLAPIQQNYTINTFFWFIEARQTPEAAPLTIWLNGGPGSSSMFGLFNEVGPCEVVQMNDGTYGTRARLWGWDRSSNILFIDQPNEVGFSFDTATNASFDLFAGEVYEPPTPPSSDLPRFMYMNGTFGTSSFDDEVPYATTANTSDIAAQATWHFLQSWLSAFPQYNPAVRPNATVPGLPPVDAAGVNLFSESYGGKYGPVFARYFEEQNQRRQNGSLPRNSTLAIRLDSLGIINGLVDDLVQDYYFPMFAYNNTYDIQAIGTTDQLNDIRTYNIDCAPAIQACRQAMLAEDPEGYGDDQATNELCSDAQYKCNELQRSYIESGRYVYDIRQEVPSPDPPAAYQEYLNNQTVLAAIGARINYTESNPYVQAGFISTGDTIRGGQLEDLAYLLSIGVKVALIYGDSDYICNWYGGQAVSLAIASLLNGYPSGPPQPGLGLAPPYSSGFPDAGYADIVINSTTVQGAVRQYGNLSFSRIYEAGHFMPYYQPEAAFTVFTRIIQGTDISTGDVIDDSSFGSGGPANATYTNTEAYAPSPTCWVRAWNQSCKDDDTEAMLSGKGLVRNGIFYQNEGDAGLPKTSVTAGVPGFPASGSLPGMSGGPDGTGALTGVYTATGTPSSDAAVSGLHPSALDVRWAPLSAVVGGIVVGFAVML